LTPHRPGKTRLRIRVGGQYPRVARVVRGLKLETVCESALCPNILECWGSGTATFMILGDVCTRSCRFCYVRKGRPKPLDPGEPRRVAEAVLRLGLDYVTITSVDRDDLPDGGAEWFARTVREVKELSPATIVEVLTPDFGGSRDSVGVVVKSAPEVFAHNIETVERLTGQVRDPRASYSKSLDVLAYAKEFGVITKSSILVGMGEEVDEVIDAMRDLRSVGVDILVISQYLRPSRLQLPVRKYYSMKEFRMLEKTGYRLGFAYVVSHPLARTSYRAREAYYAAVKRLRSKGHS